MNIYSPAYMSGLSSSKPDVEDICQDDLLKAVADSTDEIVLSQNALDEILEDREYSIGSDVDDKMVID